MDKELLLTAEIQAFIKAHEKDDLPALIMQKKFAHLPLREIAEQIKGRQKAEKKFPSWYETEKILYPPTISIEQSSSEVAARFKARLISGKTSLDLTGGFGVDSYYLAKQVATHTYVEENVELATIAEHNFPQLGQNNIPVHKTSAETFLKQNNTHFDLIYIDPDRRPGNKRVSGFKDSKPDILHLLPSLFKITDTVMVKASPMLDISLALNQLKNVVVVVVLAIENEVKELLFLLDKTADNETLIRSVNISKGKEYILEYHLSELFQESLKISGVDKYLYEPNAAIMKSGGYDLLCKRFVLQKLAANTHLYTNDKRLEDFPGRSFIVKGNVTYNKQYVLPLLPSSRANISTRNFPDTPEQIKKKLGLKDGGSHYLFAYRDMHNKPMIAVCEKC